MVQKLRKKLNKIKTTLKRLTIERVSKGHVYLKTEDFDLRNELKLPKEYELEQIDEALFLKLTNTIRTISKNDLTQLLIAILTVLRVFTNNREAISNQSIKSILVEDLEEEDLDDEEAEEREIFINEILTSLQTNKILKRVGISIIKHPSTNTHFFIQVDEQKLDQTIKELKEEAERKRKLFERFIGRELIAAGIETQVVIGMKDWKSLADWQEEMDLDSDQVPVISIENGRSRMFIVSMEDLKITNNPATTKTAYEEHMASIDEEEGPISKITRMRIDEGVDPEIYF